MYISGGRNVALKQTARQSSVHIVSSKKSKQRLLVLTADLALDGNTNQDSWDGESCTHTNRSQENFWSVTLSIPALVNRYVIYNRIDENLMHRLLGFVLRSFDEDNQVVFNYTDENTSPKAIYLISHKNLSVKEVVISLNGSQTVLTLCEVEIYGDSECDYGYFGLECEQTCNCFFQEECFVSTGGCTSDCATGYLGKDCNTPCPSGQYGPSCTLSCSAFCARTSEDNKTCHHVTGECLNGCEIGYKTPTCVS
ncbi:unnamed protein product, partial [Candidula unifasciata]